MFYIIELIYRLKMSIKTKLLPVLQCDLNALILFAIYTRKEFTSSNKNNLRMCKFAKLSRFRDSFEAFLRLSFEDKK